MLCRAVFIYIRYTTHLSYQISFFLVLAPTHVVSVNLVVQVREEGIKRWNENFFSCNKTIFGGSVFFPRPEKKKKDRQKKVTPKHTLARVLCVCVCVFSTLYEMSKFKIKTIEILLHLYSPLLLFCYSNHNKS